MKILFATMPFSGHFNPLTGVAARLREQDHDVRWYAAPSFAQRVEAVGVEPVLFRRAAEVTEQTLPELYPERASLRGPKLIAFEFARVFTDNIPAHVADVTELHGEWAFDRLICDDAFYAASILGPTLGVPVHTLSPGPSLIPSRDVPPPFFGLRPARHVLDRVAHAVVRRMVHSTMKQGLVTFNRARLDAGLEPITPGEVLSAVEDVAAMTYQAGLPETDYPRSDPPPRFQYVGGLLPQRVQDDTNPVIGRIADWSGPVAVVSQGTVDNRDPDKLLAPTIEALAHGDVLVVAVTAGLGTDALRARFPGPNVIIEDYLDFGALLPHADVFVCNGGHGSVMLGLSHSLPLVVAGTREGKNDINARLAWRGLAQDLRTEHPKPAEIARAVDSVLTDEAMRARVARVAERLAEYDSVEIVARGIVEPESSWRPAAGLVP